MNMAAAHTGIALVLLFQTVSLVTAKDTYTAQEMELLPKYRERVQNELTQDYMSENKYLIRFLRAKDLDLDAAEEMMKENLKWREANSMDNILSEDFSWWEERYPFHFLKDASGRPALASGLSGINFRKFVLGGKGNEVKRYILYAFESSVKNIQTVSNETGVEYVDGGLLFNLAGYNARTIACVACVPYGLEILEVYEKYYPLMGRPLIGINAPRGVEVVATARALSPLHARTIGTVQIYGHNKEEWRREIMKIYSPANVPSEFGGTLKLKKY